MTDKETMFSIEVTFVDGSKGQGVFDLALGLLITKHLTEDPTVASVEVTHPHPATERSSNERA